MALMQFFFESRYLQGNTLVDVILPDLPRRLEPKEFYRNNVKYPVLWLLHGSYGDATDWQRRTNIELYATDRNVIVVMPSALNSNYSNWTNYMNGYHCYDYITEELMPLIYDWFPASEKREDNFIAGLSMGGRATIKFAVNYPEKFGAMAALSATPTDWSEMGPDNPNRTLNTNAFRLKNSITNAGGLENYLNSEENTWRIINEKASTGELPRLMFACGLDEGALLENMLKFKKHAEEDLGLDIHYFFLPGYHHEWRFWDKAIQEALDFFGLKPTGDSVF